MVARLRDIINHKITSLERVKDYDTASWSHKQAHINGRLEALDEILHLIGNFKENE